MSDIYIKCKYIFVLDSGAESQGGEQQQLLFEVLRVVRQLGDPVHHLLDGGRVGVVEGGGLGGGHHRLQQVAQHVAGVHHAVGHLGRRGLAGQRVPDEHQLVGAEDDELAVRHEDARRLPGAHAAEEGVHGAEQRGEVLAALLRVEAQQLAVAGAHAAGGGGGRGGGARRAAALVRDPLGHVVLHRPDHLLLQLLELVELRGERERGLRV